MSKNTNKPSKNRKSKVAPGKTGVSKRAKKRVSKSGSVKAGKTKLFPIPHFPNIVIWEYEPSTGKMNWSPNVMRLFHFRGAEMVPRSISSFEAMIYAEDLERFSTGLRECIDEGKEFINECRVRTAGGSFSWLEFAANPPAQTRGRKKVIGSLQDITSQKLTEFELADWKTRHELVSESAGLLIYDYDIQSGHIIWSGNTEQVVGFHQHEMEHIEQWEQLVHPEDRENTFQMLEQSKSQLKPFDVYYRFQIRNKGYSFMHDRGMFVTDANGNAVRMLGIMSDVSERVTAIQTIQQSEKSYRELFDSVGEAIYIQNPDGTFLDVNQEACKMYGYTKEEMIGKTPEFLSAPGRNDFEKLGHQIEEALKGKPQSFIWWGKRKKGGIFLKEVRLTKSTYFGAETIIATAWDITEKVEAERSLQESEKRFRRMVEDLNVGVILQGPRGDVQIVNKNALMVLRISEEALLNKSLRHPDLEFFTEDGRLVPEKELPWNIAGRKKISVRGVVLGIRGVDSEIGTWLLVNAEPTLLEQEKLLHVLVTLTDVTERKKIELDLKESELRFRTLQEASFGGIGLHNKGFIMDCNQGLCDITGFSYDELIGSNGLNLIAPEYRDEVLKRILTKSEDPYDVEGLRKDGTRYFLEIKGKNIPFGDGLIRVTEFRNITERKLGEAKMLEQNARLISITEDLKLRNEQLREFTQIVSHNLRAPVGNILSLLNFIENADNHEEQQEYISLLKEAGTTTLTTLNELNEVLQIKQDKKIERQRLKFSEVFRHVRNMLNAKIAEADAEIITDFSKAPEVEYPNIYLESILLNLLSNALKYTFPGRKPVIRVATERPDDQSILLAVSDNGAGINLERYGDHIFKLRKTFHKHPESRGIGLFMIKNQIEAMGGDIALTSKEKEGSTFFITFNQPLFS